MFTIERACNRSRNANVNDDNDDAQTEARADDAGPNAHDVETAPPLPQCFQVRPPKFYARMPDVSE